MRLVPKPAGQTSDLTPGWHPAFFCGMSEEPTPAGWATPTPTIWRWHFLVWAQPADIANGTPERQTGISSAVFNDRSKAYAWACSLTQQALSPQDAFDTDELCPIACRVKIERTPGKDFAKLVDVETYDLKNVPACVPAYVQELKAKEKAKDDLPDFPLPAYASTAAQRKDPGMVISGDDSDIPF